MKLICISHLHLFRFLPSTNTTIPVAGIIGAGGASGAVVFGFGFLFLANTQSAYSLMGSIVILASIATLGLNIRGHGGIFLKLSNKDQWRQSVLSTPFPSQAVLNALDSDEQDNVSIDHVELVSPGPSTQA